MELVMKGCFLFSILLQTRNVCGLPTQLVSQGDDNNADSSSNNFYQNLREFKNEQPTFQARDSFVDASDIHGRTEYSEYVPGTLLQDEDKLVDLPRVSLDSIVRNYIRITKMHDTMTKSGAVGKRLYDPFTEQNNQLNRVKRQQDIDDVASDIADMINGVCLTNECVEVFKQFMEWRKENGYPAYTGVTYIG